MPKKKTKIEGNDLDAIIEKYKEKYGDNAYNTGDEIDNPERISTRSPNLDFAMMGGVPIGRWSRFWGPKSGGKSLTAWYIIAEAQSMGMTCAYYNIEKQFHKKFAQRKGVNTDELHVVQGTAIEQACTFLEATFPHIDLHVIDSCSAASSMDELAAEMEERRQSSKAIAWQWGFEKAMEHFDPKRNTVIYIDHARQSRIAAMAGLSYHPPGGTFMEHHNSMTVKFQQAGWLWRDKDGYLTDDKDKNVVPSLSDQLEPSGHIVKARIEKSRVCRPNMAATMWLDYNGMEYDTIWELANAAEFFEVIEKSGNWFILPDGSKVNGKVQLRKALEDDADLRSEVKAAMMAAIDD